MRVESVGYPGPGFNFGAQGYDVGLGAWLKFPVPLKCQKNPKPYKASNKATFSLISYDSIQDKARPKNEKVKRGST